MNSVNTSVLYILIYIFIIQINIMYIFVSYSALSHRRGALHVSVDIVVDKAAGTI